MSEKNTTARTMDLQQEEAWLKSATAWQKRPYHAARRAGSEIAVYLDHYIKVAKKSGSAAQAFMSVVNKEIADHCRPEKLNKGILYIQCDSGSYLHLLRTQEAEILKKINVQCPRANIRTLRFKIRNSEL